MTGIRHLAAALAAAVLLASPQAAWSDQVELPEEAGQPTPTYYTIVKGDTLWDITEQHLEDPFKWPKVWRRNPYINNPHLIYPGNVLRITPDGIEVVRTKGPEDLPVVELEPKAQKVVVLEPPPEPKPEPFKPRVRSDLMAREGLLTDEEVETSGAIVDAAEKQVLISEDDVVYLSFADGREVSVGDRFTAYKVGRRIKHPVTGEKLGHLIDILGNVRVTDTGKVVEATVEKAFKELEKGARLKPYTEPVTEVLITEPGADVDGFVVASLERQVESASGDIVYIDKGTKDGVGAGNLMRFYRRNRSEPDPMRPGRMVELPLIDLGTAVVVEARDKTSALMIIESLRTVRTGDMVSTIHVGMAPSRALGLETGEEAAE